MALDKIRVLEYINRYGLSITFQTIVEAPLHAKLGTPTGPPTIKNYSLKAVVKPTQNEKNRGKRGPRTFGEYTFYMAVDIASGITTIPNPTKNCKILFQNKTYDVTEIFEWGIYDSIVLYEVNTRISDGE